MPQTSPKKISTYSKNFTEQNLHIKIKNRSLSRDESTYQQYVKLHKQDLNKETILQNEEMTKNLEKADDIKSSQDEFNLCNKFNGQIETIEPLNLLLLN